MVEPIGGLLGAYAVGAAQPILPYALSFAAGAMIYVVVDQLVRRVRAGARARVRVRKLSLDSYFKRGCEAWVRRKCQTIPTNLLTLAPFLLLIYARVPFVTRASSFLNLCAGA